MPQKNTIVVAFVLLLTFGLLMSVNFLWVIGVCSLPVHICSVLSYDHNCRCPSIGYAWLPEIIWFHFSYFYDKAFHLHVKQLFLWTCQMTVFINQTYLRHRYQAVGNVIFQISCDKASRAHWHSIDCVILLLVSIWQLII